MWLWGTAYRRMPCLISHLFTDDCKRHFPSVRTTFNTESQNHRFVTSRQKASFCISSCTVLLPVQTVDMVQMWTRSDGVANNHKTQCYWSFLCGIQGVFFFFCETVGFYRNKIFSILCLDFKSTTTFMLFYGLCHSNSPNKHKVRKVPYGAGMPTRNSCLLYF